MSADEEVESTLRNQQLSMQVQAHLQKERNALKYFHIKQTKRAALQLFKNLWVFYDDSLPLKDSDAVIKHLCQQIEHMFPAKIPREVKHLLEQIRNVKLIGKPSQKYDKLKMTKDEFVRSFVSDQVLGPVNLACKKMIDSKTQVPAELIFMPCDFLYAIFNRSVKDYEHKAYFHQIETEEEFYQRKNDILTRERTTKGMTLGYKIEGSEVMIEVPVHRDRDFIVLMNTVLIPSGSILFQRRLYGMLGRKNKLVLT